jgi:hypothetical protein
VLQSIPDESVHLSIYSIFFTSFIFYLGVLSCRLLIAGKQQSRDRTAAIKLSIRSGAKEI